MDLKSKLSTVETGFAAALNETGTIQRRLSQSWRGK